jgi:hypothetical protein
MLIFLPTFHKDAYYRIILSAMIMCLREPGGGMRRYLLKRPPD